jgi:hypothetical protein
VGWDEYRSAFPPPDEIREPDWRQFSTLEVALHRALVAAQSFVATRAGKPACLQVKQEMDFPGLKGGAANLSL